MLQRIKDALDSTVLWIIFLVGCIAYFWRKERDLEDKLEEEKINETLKSEKKAVSDADDASNSADEHYADLRRQYLDEHPND